MGFFKRWLGGFKTSSRPLTAKMCADIYNIARARPVDPDLSAWQIALQNKYSKYQWSVSMGEDGRYNITRKSFWRTDYMHIPVSCMQELPRYDAYMASLKAI